MKSMIRLVITGNPGVGKHTIAKFVVDKMRGVKVIDINTVAINNNAILRKDDRYGIDVDVKKTSKLMADKLENIERLCNHWTSRTICIKSLLE